MEFPSQEKDTGQRRACNVQTTMLPQHLQALVSSMVQRYHFGRPTLAEVRAELEEARQRRGRRPPAPPTTPLSDACQLPEEEEEPVRSVKKRRRRGAKEQVLCKRVRSKRCADGRGGGDGTTVEPVGRRPFNHSGRLPYLVRHRAEVDACVPMALLNLLNASRSKKKKLMRVFGGGSGLGCLRELARVAGVLGRNLHRVSIDLVDLTCGLEELFLVMRGVHCVGVDCQRGLIWDCVRETALELNTKNLLMCVATTGEIAIRKVSA